MKLKQMSLVNILAGRELVPEFMPFFNSIDPIVESIEGYLGSKDELARLSTELADMTRPLGQMDTGQEVALTIVEMLD